MVIGIFFAINAAEWYEKKYEMSCEYKEAEGRFSELWWNI